jgi:hypothetical protein
MRRVEFCQLSQKTRGSFPNRRSVGLMNGSRRRNDTKLRNVRFRVIIRVLVLLQTVLL